MTKKYAFVFTGLVIIMITGLFWIRMQVGSPIQYMVTPPPSPSPYKTTLHLRAVGDVMLGRHVAVEASRRKDWRWPFTGTTPFLPPADLMIGNLETPIIQDCPLTSIGMTFCAPEAAMEGLRYAGFDILSLANNHTTNYGTQGLKDTEALLTAQQMHGIPDYKSTIVTANNESIGFLALNDTFVPINSSRAGVLISELKTQTDLVIALVHWGNEYEPLPSKRQQLLADQFIQSGATIILGAHPHVLQPVEIKDDSLIAYSLGNFVFDQMWSDETRRGEILDIDVTLTDHRVSAINYQQHFTTIYDYGQPRIDQ